MFKKKQARSVPPAESGSGSRGFTLIEVLIAFLVLAIGLVGISSLHLTSLSSAHSSYLRSVSSSVALDLEEQLWMELAETDPDTCPSAANAIARTREIWAGEAADWTQAKRASIPGIENDNAITFETEDGVASPSGTPFWTTVTFTLSWADERFEGEEARETFSFQTNVPCNVAVPPT